MYTFLGPERFEKRYGNIFRDIFRGENARRDSFRHGDWHFLLAYCALLNSREEFQLLCNAIKLVEDEEIVITSLEPHQHHRWSIAIPCDFDSFLAAMKSEVSGPLLGLRQHVFGSSGRWAAIIDNDTSYVSSGHVILGGEEAFIERWANSKGGVGALREAFKRGLDCQLPGPKMPDEVKTALLADVGW